MNYQITMDESSWNQLCDLLSDRKDDAFDYWVKAGYDLNTLGPGVSTSEYHTLYDIYMRAHAEYVKRYQVWSVVYNALEVPENVVVDLENGEHHD